MHQRVCETCTKPFETDVGNRRNCYRCSPQRLKVAGAPEPAPAPYIPPSEPQQPRSAGRVEKATLAELEALGWLETVDGALAALLARDLDGDELPGAQRTSMSKQLSAMMAEIRAQAPAEPDALDGIKDRIREKRERA